MYHPCSRHHIPPPLQVPPLSFTTIFPNTISYAPNPNPNPNPSNTLLFMIRYPLSRTMPLCMYHLFRYHPLLVPPPTFTYHLLPGIITSHMHALPPSSSYQPSLVLSLIPPSQIIPPSSMHHFSYSSRLHPHSPVPPPSSRHCPAFPGTSFSKVPPPSSRYNLPLPGSYPLFHISISSFCHCILHAGTTSLFETLPSSSKFHLYQVQSITSRFQPPCSILQFPLPVTTPFMQVPPPSSEYKVSLSRYRYQHQFSWNPCLQSDWPSPVPLSHP